MLVEYFVVAKGRYPKVVTANRQLRGPHRSKYTSWNLMKGGYSLRVRVKQQLSQALRYTSEVSDLANPY